MRVVVGAVILLAMWLLVSKVLDFFDMSVGRKTAAVLSVVSTDNVQVALQEQEWQRAENGLKLYAGDAVATRGNGDATLKFFDGTKVRLDAGTDVVVKASDSESEGESAITLQVRSGRIWIVSTDLSAYSGAIVRTVETVNFSAEIPASTNALIGSSLINVMRAAGVGANVTLTFAKSEPTLFVGEGQYLSISEQTKRLIEDGTDPYEFRDPVTLELLKDPFLISSYAQMNSMAAGTTSSASTGATVSVPTNEQPLVLTSPENNAQINAKTVTVSGKVGARIAQVTVNGQNITIKSDLTFTAELSLPKDQPTFVITVEAQDVQGVPVAKVERTIKNVFTVNVEPVRFKSPVGSGETLNTAQGEIEITGEVSAGIATVVVNDYKLQLFKAGSRTWSYLASANLGNMKVGSNIFTVYATDADGNRSPSRSITINYQPAATNNGTGATASSSQPALKQNPPLTPGVLVVDTPAAGTSATTSEKEVVIEGRTSAETASISINGYTLSLYQAGKTTWNYIASTEFGTMKRGKNVYRVVARNVGGEILDVLEYTITFNP